VGHYQIQVENLEKSLMHVAVEVVVEAGSLPDGVLEVDVLGVGCLQDGVACREETAEIQRMAAEAVAAHLETESQLELQNEPEWMKSWMQQLMKSVMVVGVAEAQIRLLLQSQLDSLY